MGGDGHAGGCFLVRASSFGCTILLSHLHSLHSGGQLRHTAGVFAKGGEEMGDRKLLLHFRTSYFTQVNRAAKLGIKLQLGSIGCDLRP